MWRSIDPYHVQYHGGAVWLSRCGSCRAPGGCGQKRSAISQQPWQSRNPPISLLERRDSGKRCESFRNKLTSQPQSIQQIRSQWACLSINIALPIHRHLCPTAPLRWLPSPERGCAVLCVQCRSIELALRELPPARNCARTTATTATTATRPHSRYSCPTVRKAGPSQAKYHVKLQTPNKPQRTNIHHHSPSPTTAPRTSSTCRPVLSERDWRLSVRCLPSGCRLSALDPFLAASLLAGR